MECHEIRQENGSYILWRAASQSAADADVKNKSHDDIVKIRLLLREDTFYTAYLQLYIGTLVDIRIPGTL